MKERREQRRKHYPSEVLFGAALGHFVTAFAYDAFGGLGGDANSDVTFHFTGVARELR